MLKYVHSHNKILKEVKTVSWHLERSKLDFCVELHINFSFSYNFLIINLSWRKFDFHPRYKRINWGYQEKRVDDVIVCLLSHIVICSLVSPLCHFSLFPQSALCLFPVYVIEWNYIHWIQIRFFVSAVQKSPSDKSLRFYLRYFILTTHTQGHSLYLGKTHLLQMFKSMYYRGLFLHISFWDLILTLMWWITSTFSLI